MTKLEELRLAYAECSRQRNELLNKLKEQAQRTWVGLTDEDKAEIKKQANYNWETTAGEYASKVQALTEARLKAKNSL